MAKSKQEKELVTEQSGAVATQEKPKKTELFANVKMDEFTESEYTFIITLMNKGKTAKEAREACIKHRSLGRKQKNADAVNTIKHRQKYKEDQVEKAKEKQAEEEKKRKAELAQREAEIKASEIKKREALEIQELIKNS